MAFFNIIVSKFFSRWVALGLLILLVSLVGVIYAATTRYDNIYDRFRKLDLQELKDKGNAYISEHQPDSALACYMMITSRYSDNMSLKDKNLVASAYNNAGYVYSLVYTDYSRAYQLLLKSLKIAKENGFKNLMPYIYLNLGNLYLYYEDANNAFEYYRKAYHSGKQEKEWEVVSITFSNLLLTTPGFFPEDKMIDIVKDYNNSNITEGHLVDFNRQTCEMLKFYYHGKYKEAHEQLIQAKESLDIGYLPERYDSKIKDWESILLRKQKRYADALSILKAPSEGVTAGDMVGRYKDIEAIYDEIGVPDSAIAYKIKAINLQDSLSHDHNYAMIRDMHASFELQEFEQDIKNIEIRRKHNATIAIILLVSVVILLVFIYLLIRKNKRLNEALTDLYRKIHTDMSAEYESVPLVGNDSALIDEVPCVSSMECDNSIQSEGTGEVVENQKTERQKFQIDEAECTEIRDKIISVMQKPDVICQCEFTIKKLAEMIGIRERYVSFVLNDYMHCNFNTLLNEYRIRRAQQLLEDKDSMKNLTVEGVALSLGFKSRSNFANIFKKITGLTPTEYRNIAKEENRQ